MNRWNDKIVKEFTLSAEKLFYDSHLLIPLFSWHPLEIHDQLIRISH